MVARCVRVLTARTGKGRRDGQSKTTSDEKRRRKVAVMLIFMIAVACGLQYSS